MTVQVGDEIIDVAGDIGTVVAIAGNEAAYVQEKYGLCVAPLCELEPRSVVKPPLSNEQMAYVLETLADKLTSRLVLPVDGKALATEKAVLAVAAAINNAAKEFRK